MMSTNIHEANKERVNALRAAHYDIEPSRLPAQLKDVFARDCES